MKHWNWLMELINEQGDTDPAEAVDLAERSRSVRSKLGASSENSINESQAGRHSPDSRMRRLWRFIEIIA
jgi:hypothetical protein